MIVDAGDGQKSNDVYDDTVAQEIDEDCFEIEIYAVLHAVSSKSYDDGTDEQETETHTLEGSPERCAENFVEEMGQFWFALEQTGQKEER